MRSGNVSVDAVKMATERLTVNVRVTGIRQLRLRLWLALRLIWLLKKVVPGEFRVEMTE